MKICAHTEAASVLNLVLLFSAGLMWLLLPTEAMCPFIINTCDYVFNTRLYSHLPWKSGKIQPFYQYTHSIDSTLFISYTRYTYISIYLSIFLYIPDTILSAFSCTVQHLPPSVNVHITDDSSNADAILWFLLLSLSPK